VKRVRHMVDISFRANDAFKAEQVESSQVDQGLQSLFSFIHITQIPKGLFSSDV